MIRFTVKISFEMSETGKFLRGSHGIALSTFETNYL